MSNNTKTADEIWLDDVRRDKIKLHLSYCLLLIILATLGYSYYMGKKWYQDYLNLLQRDLSRVKAQEAKAATLDKPLTPKEYALDQAVKAGLKAKDVECLLKHESRFNVNAIGINPTSADIGLWQINSQHIKSGRITLECASNYKCASDWSIKKIKSDKGYGAWYGFTNYCQ